MKKITMEEFAEQIRKKYPGSYDDLSDEKLVELWLKKFPDDKNKIHPDIFDDSDDSKPFLTRNKYWLVGIGIVLLLIKVSLRPLIQNGYFDTLVPKKENFIKIDGKSIELKYGYMSNSFEGVYFYEKKPSTDEYGEPESDLSDDPISGINMDLCHWEDNSGPLQINPENKIKELPIGEYSFNKEKTEGGNWHPYTVTDCYFFVPNINTENDEIKSGSLSITKHENLYSFDWKFVLASGREITGNYTGPLSMYD